MVPDNVEVDVPEEEDLGLEGGGPDDVVELEPKPNPFVQPKSEEMKLAEHMGQKENVLPPQPDPNTATPPEFPIGTEPEMLGLTPEKTGDTSDMQRMEEHNAETAGETPEHCPTCRGRGFIGGAVCPDCEGKGVAAPPVEPPDPNVNL